MTPLDPVLAEIEKHLDDALRHAATLDPKTDGEAIIASIRIARGYLASARTIVGVALTMRGASDSPALSRIFGPKAAE